MALGWSGWRLVRRCLRPAAPADDSAAQITWRAGDARLIVPGECHGAPETPRVVADLVERYSRDSDMVSLAMEMPMSGNVARPRSLRSNGDSDAHEALRTSPFWLAEDDQHDGRQSGHARRCGYRDAMQASPTMTWRPDCPLETGRAMTSWPRTYAGSSAHCGPVP